jgi:long-chain fatty acid transport protein
MKKLLMFGGGLVLSFALISAAYGGAIDNRTNWSAEWVRTLNRNAATDYADIAMYNPAGTVKLNQGVTLNGSLQIGKKDYANNVSLPSALPYTGCIECESDEPSYIPGIFGVYNKGKWSLFGAFSNVAGGGKVDFSEGDFTTIGAQLTLRAYDEILNAPAPSTLIPGPVQQINGESFYLGYTLGGAYALNDIFSFSVALRYVDASRKLSGSANMIDLADPLNPVPLAVNAEEDGHGWGGILGVNIAANDKLNIGLRYETKTNLDLKAKVKEDTTIIVPVPGVGPVPMSLLEHLLGISDGQKRPRDLPAVLGLGASYWLTPKLRTEANLTYFFNEDADWGGFEDKVDNGYDVGIALEYLFTDKLKGSIGYMYTKYGVNPEDMLPENPELDVNTIGGGIAYAINDKLHTNLSIANSFYTDDSFSPSPGINVEYEKNIFFVAFGVEYRFL